MKDKSKIAVTIVGFLLIGYLVSVTVSSQFQDIKNDSNPYFDSDDDLVDKNVNTSWVQLETGEWQVDPSDTYPNRIKLEKDGRGLILLNKSGYPYNKTVYYKSSSWDQQIQNYRNKGFSIEEDPEVINHQDRKYWKINLSKEVQGTKAYIEFLATYSDNYQYTFIYSYSPRFIQEGHMEEVLNLTNSAKLR